MNSEDRKFKRFECPDIRRAVSTEFASAYLLGIQALISFRALAPTPAREGRRHSCVRAEPFLDVQRGLYVRSQKARPMWRHLQCEE
jgi:hypothetical protein